MVEKIEVEANSLEEARAIIKAQLPTGLYVLSEKVLSVGKQQTKETFAKTTEAAFEKARNEIPINAKIIDKQVLISPELSVITAYAFNEKSAKEKIKHQLKSLDVINDLKLNSVGKKGLLGIGKKPNQYEIEIIHQAVVRITYKEKVEISATIGNDISQLIRSLKNSDEYIRTTSMEALAEIGAQAVSPLLEAYEKSGKTKHKGNASWREWDDDLRESIVTVLSQAGEPVVEPLIAALKDVNMSVRLLATEALGRIGDPRAVDPLIATFFRLSAPITKTTIEALMQIGTPTVEPLKTVLNSGKLLLHVTWQDAGYIAVNLVKLGVEVTDPCLQEIIQHLNHWATKSDDDDYFDDDWKRISGKSYQRERNEAKSILKKLGLS